MLDNFVSHIAFTTIFTETFTDVFRAAGKNVAEQVAVFVKRIFQEITRNRYSAFQKKLQEVTNKFIDQKMKQCEDHIDAVVRSEAFIFTQSETYSENVQGLPEEHVGSMQKSLEAYSNVSINRFCDHVCMIVHLFLVTELPETLQEALVEAMPLCDLHLYLVDEDSVVTKRNRLDASRKRFEKSLAVLNKVL